MTRAIERAQQKVEQRNYEIRKNLLKYDDVMNDQRKVIYEERIELMETDDVADTISAMCEEINHGLISIYVPAKSYADAWETEDLQKELFRIYGLHLPVVAWAKEEGIADEELLKRVNDAIKAHFTGKTDRYGEPLMRMAEKRILLQALDHLWKDHLLSLDHLRQGIHLRGYGQRDPLNEYKQEAFTLFEQLLSQLREMVVSRLSHLELQIEAPIEASPLAVSKKKLTESRQDPANRTLAEEMAPAPLPQEKIGRNKLCPCGSGKKYKHCHGALV